MLSGVLQHLGIAIGSAQTAAPIAGVPLAMSLAADVVRSCGEFTKQQAMAKALGEKSTQLANALQKVSEGPELQEYADEVIDVLKKVLECTQKWQRRGAAVRWSRRADIQKDLEKVCDRQLDNAIKIFEIRGLIEDAEETHHLETIPDLSLRASQNQQEMQTLVQLHDAGSPDATELTKVGQHVLKEMRLAVSDQSPSDGRHQAFDSPSSSTPTKQTDVQQYQDVQRGPAMLHRVTGTLPPDKVLNGTVRKLGELPVNGGPASDIWRGVWLEEKVALKALRKVKAGDLVAQKRFIREIEVWSRLNNDHLLQFYGIVTDLGAHLYLVSPWLENGDVLEYTKKHPGANRLDLVRGAAKGLKYLHSENIIHENLKCANILVAASGEACISDFGLPQLIEDVHTASSSTPGLSGGVRWVAPELVEGGEEGAPSKKSDVYSFGMAALELLTGKRPFSEHKSVAVVLRALVAGAHPKRPTEHIEWLDDGMWALMQRCWAREPSSRPTMEAVVVDLQEM